MALRGSGGHFAPLRPTFSHHNPCQVKANRAFLLHFDPPYPTTSAIAPAPVSMKLLAQSRA